MTILIAHLTPLNPAYTPGSLKRLSTSLDGEPWGLIVPIFAVPRTATQVEQIIGRHSIRLLVNQFETDPLLALYTLPPLVNGTGQYQVVLCDGWVALRKALSIELTEGLALTPEEIMSGLVPQRPAQTLYEPEVTETGATSNRARLGSSNPNQRPLTLRLVSFAVVDTSESPTVAGAA